MLRRRYMPLYFGTSAMNPLFKGCTKIVKIAASGRVQSSRDLRAIFVADADITDAVVTTGRYGIPGQTRRCLPEPSAGDRRSVRAEQWLVFSDSQE
jgi:hypothetical protein